MFVNEQLGSLVEISGLDPHHGAWSHQAFVPAPLPTVMPTLAASTFSTLMNARAALAALDSTARRLPNPTLLRATTLRREAQSTSALEGTHAPLSEVLAADVEHPETVEMREILNYVRMAEMGFSGALEGRPLSLVALSEMQGVLMGGTPLESVSGNLRDVQVVIGRRPHADHAQLPIHAARFVPPPPGDELAMGVTELLAWMRTDFGMDMDPVVAAGMAHYQFETLHPFRDGNGRLGRLLIVIQLLSSGVLSEPTLTVSPWFEARRSDYYDALLGVSARGDWDSYLTFFARGLAEAATSTHTQMLSLVEVQAALKEEIRQSKLRADSAHALVDLAVANPTFTVRMVEAQLDLSYNRANALVGQLVNLGVLRNIGGEYNRRFYAPRVFNVLLGS